MQASHTLQQKVIVMVSQSKKYH